MPPRIRRRITSAKREEIEKEQEAISRSIVRPFEVVSGLPVSYNPPGNYDEVLKNPLTVKDSGILYRSLMKSRQNYMFQAPMFQLYWVKQSLYSRKIQSDQNANINRVPVLGTDINARDVMVKLCDAGLTVGPHSFEVRLFIVKDDRDKVVEVSTEQKVASVTEEKVVDTEEKAIENDTEEKVEEKTEEKTEEKMEQTPDINVQTPIENIEKSIEKPTETPEPNISSESVGPRSESIGPPSESPHPHSQSHNPQISSQIKQEQNDLPQQNQEPFTEKKKKYDSSDLDSPINQMMLQNLRSLARFDTDLEKLMGDVSQGKETPEQLSIFQGYVARAREMGPPPHPFLVPNFKIDPFQPLRVKRLMRELRQFKDRRLFGTYVKEQRLTAFQEKYLTDATLLFEFVDNANVRYRIPRHAITEVLASQSSGEDRDILISFLWIHNQHDLDKYEADKVKYYKFIEEKQQKEKEERERLKAEQERQKLIEQGKLPPDEPVEEKRLRRKPNVKKPKKEPKEPEFPIEPELKFTPVSFVLHDIPTKFVPLITNSVEEPEKVREYMTNIMSRGIKSSSFYLWYQVDGKLDENIAESIRSQLAEEEKRTTGLNYGANVVVKRRKIMSIGQV